MTQREHHLPTQGAARHVRSHRVAVQRWSGRTAMSRTPAAVMFARICTYMVAVMQWLCWWCEHCHVFRLHNAGLNGLSSLTRQG